MKMTIRLTSFILIISIMACCLLSCDLIFGKDPKVSVEKAEAALSSAPYTVEMAIKYESTNQTVVDAIKCLETPVIKLEVDGDNLRAAMSMSLDGKILRATYTIFDGTVYRYGYEKIGENETVTKEKCASTDNLFKEAISSLGEGANLRYDDFEEAKERVVDGVSLITCTKIKDEALTGVCAMMEDSLSGLDATVGVNNASLVIQIENGKYKATVFTCTYVVTTSTDVYTISMTFAAQFKYDEAVKITAPSDASEYKDISGK